MKHKILLSAAGFLVVAAGIIVGLLWNRGAFEKADAENPTQFIQHDFVDLTKIGSISKFRSGEGHDFSSGGETCRSMKHYFTPAYTAADMKELQNQPLTQGRRLPPAPTSETAVAIYSPVDGKITDVQSEQFPVGKQIFITPTSAPGYNIRIFHVYLLDGIDKGTTVTAGQHIGNISRLSSTDISIEAGRLNGKFISYFDVMPDSVFSAYTALGIKQRSELIFSKEFRDAHPFTCNGEAFTEQHEGGDQEVYLNGWTIPKETSQGENTSSQRDVTLHLFQSNNSGEVKNRGVNVTTGSGRTFSGETSSSGTITVPAEYIGTDMTLLVDGFQSTTIPYQQALTGDVTLRITAK
jgi:hypothetical protein